MTNIINFPIVEPIAEPSIDKWADSEQITGEMLVEFLIAHGITCAGELEDLSQFLQMLRGHPFTPAGTVYS